MCGSSGGGQLKPLTTSTTTADPRAQAMYQQAFGTAQQASQTPFQRYSTDPRAFVAQLTPTQQQAISNIAQSQGVYQPYYGAAAGLAGSAGQTSTADVVGQYMSPYMRQVVDPVRAALEQQQGMQLSQQQAEAIKGGAFGGERAGLQRAALRGQQQLGMGQALSPLYQTGYGQALGAAQGDLSRQLQAGQLFGQLGTGAQTAAMQGSQALLGAGTLQQQTQQAGLQALLNQYLMERGYPFQTSQFLTSAAAGLGPLYGGTTVEQQAVNPFGQFLSDPRAKTGVDREEPDVVGKLNDGQNVYAYKYAAGGPAQIGLMADEVAQRYPEAVGQRPDGLMTVDYGKATEVPAAMSSGLGAARMGGAVTDGGDYARGGYVIGGHLSYVDPNDPGASDRRRMDALLSSHRSGTDTFVPTKMDIPTGSVQASQGLQPARMSGGQRQQSEGLAGLLGKGAKMGESAAKLAQTYDFFKDRLFKRDGGPSAAAIKAASTSHPGGELYASGGMPSIDIPTEAIRASRGLEPARISDSGREEEDDGILGGLSKAADIGSKLAGIGTFAMKAAPFVMSLSDPRAKTGVRHGYADRGSVPAEDDIFERGLLGAESAHRQFDREGRTLTSPKGALGIAQIMPGTAPEAAKLAGLDYDPVRLRQDPEYNKALGKAYFDEQRRRFGSDELAAAAYNAGPGAVQKALRRAEATGQDVMSFLPAETRAYVPKVLGRGSVDDAAKGIASVRRDIPMGDPRRSFMAKDQSSEAGAPSPAGLGAAKPAEEPGFMDKYAREEYIVPGLVGLAGAVEGALSAPTTSLGAALARGAATGIGAGAKAYEDIQTAQPTRERIRQEASKIGTEAAKIAGVDTERQKAEIGEISLRTAANAIHRDPEGNPIDAVVFDEAGNAHWVPFSQIMENPSAYNLSPIVANEVASQKQRGTRITPSPATNPPAEPLKIEPAPPIPVGVGWGGQSSEAAAKGEYAGYLNSADKAQLKDTSRKYIGKVRADASAAEEDRFFTNQIAAVIGKASQDQLLSAPGSGAQWRANLVGALNTVVKSIPGLENAGNVFGDLKERSEILEKIHQLRGMQQVGSAQERSLGALERQINAMPNLWQDPKASAANIASQIVQNRMKMDRLDHLNQYTRHSKGLANNAETDFIRNNKTEKYGPVQKAIQSMLTDPGGYIDQKDPSKGYIPPGWKVYESLESGQIDAKTIEEYFKRLSLKNQKTDNSFSYMPGISRFFGEGIYAQ